MEIINMIIKNWLSNENKFRDEILEQQKHHEILQSKIDNLKDEYNDKNRKINDIYKFLDDVKVGKDIISSEAKDSFFNDVINISKKIKEIQEEDSLTLNRIEMYNFYLGIITRQYVDVIEITELRNKHRIYIPIYEFCIDVFLLDKKARGLIEKKKNKYEYKTYKEALEIFSDDEMKKLGHPINDVWFTDGTSNLINAICRVSWELEYMDELDEEYGKLNKGKEKDKLVEPEKKNIIFDSWYKDNLIISNSSKKENLFYKSYKNVLPDRKSYDEFIHSINTHRKSIF